MSHKEALLITACAT